MLYNILLSFIPEPFVFSSVGGKVKIKIYKTIILPAVLYVCETRSLTLKEEYMLRVFANRVLRRIFGPKMDEVKGGWRKLHNKELHDWYTSSRIIRIIRYRRMRWAGHVARMRQKRNVYWLLVGKPYEKRPLGRMRRRWVDDNKMDFTEMGLGGADWIGMAQESSCECGNEPSGSITCWKTIEWLHNWWPIEYYSAP
jgi:hypothetical protein